MKKSAVQALALLTLMAGFGDRVVAQSAPSSASLRADIERRFDVLPLQNGIALRPRDASRAVRSIEVGDGPIAIDGQAASGAEVRGKLGGADADLVFRLSYLSADERRAMFGAGSTAAQPAIQPPVEPPPGPQTERRRSRSQRRNDRVQMGGSVTIAEGDVVDGDVVGIGGDVTVDGEVHGNVVAIGGEISLGPRSSVDEDVVAIGGSLRQDPGARIGGRAHQVTIGGFDIRRLRRLSDPDLLVDQPPRAGLALFRQIAHVVILSLLAVLVVLFGQRYVSLVGDRAGGDTMKSGAIGFLCQLLFVPALVVTIVLLVVTIVGIPLLLLLPFALLGLVIVGLVGFTGVAHQVGTRTLQWLNRPSDNPYWTTIAGVAVVLSPILVARLIGLAGGVLSPLAFAIGVAGFVLEYVAWTVGFGAVALARFGRGHSAVPPVLATA